MARFNRGHSGKQMPVANYFHHDPKCTFLDSMMRLAPRSVTERDSGAAQFYERCAEVVRLEIDPLGEELKVIDAVYIR
jgi:hypothetical protein